MEVENGPLEDHFPLSDDSKGRRLQGMSLHPLKPNPSRQNTPNPFSDAKMPSWSY